MESKRIVHHLLALGVLLLTAPALLWALRYRARKPWTHDDYDIWKSIAHRALANNGEWIAFVVSPREGDGVMTLRSIGGQPRRSGEIDRASGPRITSDSRFLIFTIDPMFAVVDSLEKAEGEAGRRYAQGLPGGHRTFLGLQRRRLQRRVLQGGPGEVLEDPG